MLQLRMYNGQTGRNQQQKELKIVYSQLRRRCVRGIKWWHIQLFHYQHKKIADTLEYMHSDKIHLQIYHQLLH